MIYSSQLEMRLIKRIQDRQKRDRVLFVQVSAVFFFVLFIFGVYNLIWPWIQRIWSLI